MPLERDAGFADCMRQMQVIWLPERQVAHVSRSEVVLCTDGRPDLGPPLGLPTLPTQTKTTAEQSLQVYYACIQSHCDK